MIWRALVENGQNTNFDVNESILFNFILTDLLDFIDYFPKRLETERYLST